MNQYLIVLKKNGESFKYIKRISLKLRNKKIKADIFMAFNSENLQMKKISQTG